MKVFAGYLVKRRVVDEATLRCCYEVQSLEKLGRRVEGDRLVLRP